MELCDVQVLLVLRLAGFSGMWDFVLGDPQLLMNCHFKIGGTSFQRELWPSSPKTYEACLKEQAKDVTRSWVDGVTYLGVQISGLKENDTDSELIP